MNGYELKLDLAAEELLLELKEGIEKYSVRIRDTMRDIITLGDMGSLAALSVLQRSANVEDFLIRELARRAIDRIHGSDRDPER